MVKILHIITGLGTGGAETMLLKLLSGIDRYKFEIFVISLTKQEGIDDDIRKLGIPVISLKMTKGISIIAVFIQLILHIRKIKPNIVQTWMYHADLFGGIAAKLAGRASVVWGIRHSSLNLSKDKRSTRWVAKICGLSSGVIPTKIICNSRISCKSHIKLGYNRSKMMVIPNGFNTDKFFPNSYLRQIFRNEIGVSDSTCLIGLIARFSPIKGHQIFIDAAGEVYKENKNIFFVLCGEDVTKDNIALIMMLKKANIEQATFLLGKRVDMPKIHVGLDILVSSSYGEGFSNVIGEAMACETPCVVTDVGDSAFIVDESGMVVPADNPDALATAILKMAQLSPAERRLLGKQARDRIQSKFSLLVVVRKYEELYKDILN